MGERECESLFLIILPLLVGAPAEIGISMISCFVVTFGFTHIFKFIKRMRAPRGDWGPNECDLN